jgi:hypothetical protein
MLLEKANVVLSIYRRLLRRKYDGWSGVQTNVTCFAEAAGIVCEQVAGRTAHS